MRAWLAFLLLTACGRIGIDEHRGGGDDALGDATGDGPSIDAPLACPSDMTRLSPSSSVCIEIDDRGPMLWLDGKAVCEGLGRRYCADAEWLEGCQNASGLVDITGDDYEWVAEEDAGTAQKRGNASCDDASAHVITDPYEVRCCGPMISP